MPIVVFTGRELTAEEEAELRKKAKSIVVKGVRSPERLLDETALFLHRMVEKLPPAKQRMLESLHETDEALLGRKVLVVDDDVRNIFALSSLLERHGMSVASATTGQEAINQIDTQPDLQIVLMDIMMPEMDGYETMQRIRKDARYPPPADHRADGEGDEGRPREMPRGRRFRLHREAGQHEAVAVAGPHVAASLSPGGRAWSRRKRSTSCWWTTSSRAC